MKQLFTDVAHDSLGTANVFSVLPQFAQGTTPGGITPGALQHRFQQRERQRRDHGQRSVPASGGPVRVAQRHRGVHHRRPGAERARFRHLEPRRGPRAARHLVGVPARRRRRMHHRRRVRDQRLRRVSLGRRRRPRPHDLRRGDRPDHRDVGRPRRRSAGLPGRRGGHGRGRPRDGRGDDRSRGHRLDGSQRVRGRRQVRVRAPAREPARLRAGRVAVQPGRQRPPVPVPADVVKRRQLVRAAHEPDRAIRCRCRRSTSRSSARWSAATSSPPRRASASR